MINSFMVCVRAQPVQRLDSAAFASIIDAHHLRLSCPFQISVPAYPLLRPLDIRPTFHQGRASLLLRDPLDLSDRYLILPQALGPALILCDGQHDPARITARARADYGLRIGQDVIDELLIALDQACFLQNERSAQAMADALTSYRLAPYRAPTLAGSGYPADPVELQSEFDAYLDAAGPVTPMPASGRALISPHIDFARGHKVYARVWKRAAEMVQAAEIVVALGTDHFGGFHPLTLTRQSYATPYGILPTDIDAVDILSGAIGEEAAFAGELYHRREHSLELVLVWLHHMRRGKPVAVVPILTGSYHHLADGDGSPAVDGVLAALRQIIAGRKTLVVASGDLAHIGPAFGGDPVGLIERADLRAHDDDLIGYLATGDADGLLGYIRRIDDRNNVCGVSPFYWMLKLAGPVEGQRAGYAICPADEHDTSVVSVCGMVFG